MPLLYQSQFCPLLEIPFPRGHGIIPVASILLWFSTSTRRTTLAYLDSFHFDPYAQFCFRSIPISLWAMEISPEAIFLFSGVFLQLATQAGRKQDRAIFHFSAISASPE